MTFRLPPGVTYGMCMSMHAFRRGGRAHLAVGYEDGHVAVWQARNKGFHIKFLTAAAREDLCQAPNHVHASEVRSGCCCHDPLSRRQGDSSGKTDLVLRQYGQGAAQRQPLLCVAVPETLQEELA